ncbi:MAG: putative LPS assembly protein LptD [Flavobacteriales bacterium]
MQQKQGLFCSKALLFLWCIFLSYSSYAQNTQVDSIRYAPNTSFSEPVDYFAQDSMLSFPKQKLIKLYNKAYVDYEDFKLTAGFIQIDFGKNLIYAHGLMNDSNRIVQKPIFTQDGASYESDTILFNLKSKRGKIQQLFTQEGEGFLYGYDIKRQADNTYHFNKGIYTTCSHAEPHYYIQAKKLKFTEDGKIVSGPAQLVIEGLKTPLVLPFGYFPLNEKKRFGISLPSYDFAPDRGYSLSNLGLYMGLSDYWDDELSFDIYTGGSYKIKNSFRYAKRYKFSGFLDAQYSRTKYFSAQADKFNYSVVWKHNQDAKANPFGRFWASVDLTSSDFNRNNFESFTNQVKNTYTSSINYERSFFDSWLKLNVTADHRMTRQSELSNPVVMNLPNLTLSAQTIYPFRSKKRASNHLLNKISFKPKLTSKTNIQTFDSLMFTSTMFDNLRFGAQYQLPFSIPISISNALSLTPSLSYRGLIYREKFDYQWLGNVALEEKSEIGLYHLHDIDASIGFSFNPVIYGLFQFGDQRKITALRHMLEPSISYRYRFELQDQQRYFQQVFNPNTLENEYFSRFGSHPLYGTPGSATASSKTPLGRISLALNNNFEIKVREKMSDTATVATPTFKKVKLLNALDVSTTYDLDVDSFRLANLNLSMQSNLGGGFSITSRASYNPYIQTEDRQINALFWEGSGKGVFNSASTSVSYSFSGKSRSGKSTEEKLNSIDRNQLSGEELRELNQLGTDPRSYLDFDVPFSMNLNYTLGYTYNRTSGRNLNQTMNVRGDISITPKWKIGYRTGFDFSTKKLSTSEFSFNRDMHCWQMSFSWVPNGVIKQYSFTIGVKASVLQDLKLQKQNYFYDTFL